MNNKERFLFDLQGYLVVEDVLSSSECRLARAALDEMASPLAETPDRVSANGCWRLAHGLLGRVVPFQNLIDRPAVTRILQDIIAPELRLEHVYSFVYSQGAPPLQLHAGDPDDWLTYHYHVHRGRIRTGMCVVSYVLQDIDEDSGGFVCIPGSHRSQFELSEDEWAELLSLESPLVRAIPAREGSAIIFTESLIHGARCWQKTEPRYGLFYKYNDLGARHMHPRNSPVTPEVLQQLTPQQRAFFAEPWRAGGPDSQPRNVTTRNRIPEKNRRTDG